MDLLTAGAFTSSLLSFDLTNKSWYQSGNRIRSYSCNVNDSIHRYTGIPTTAFSVYYSKVKVFFTCNFQFYNQLKNIMCLCRIMHLATQFLLAMISTIPL